MVRVARSGSVLMQQNTIDEASKAFYDGYVEVHGGPVLARPARYLHCPCPRKPPARMPSIIQRVYRFRLP